MIVAQITDLHIGFDGKDNACGNTLRLHEVVKSLRALKLQPDLILVTGDLVEHGETWSYELLKAELDQFDWPYHMALGNHDRRAAFRGVFPDQPFEGDFLNYTLEDGPLRIIVLDTLARGRHGGGFCAVRTQWLERKLSEQPERPTLIALHHPPVRTGIAWMTANIDRPWVKNLTSVISKHKQVVHMVSGHIHRPIFTRFAGTTLSVCPAVAPQVKLELADIDPSRPDDRILLTEDPPGFCLHHWRDGQMTTHVARAPYGRTIVKFDDAHASVVNHTLDLDLDD